MNQFNVCPSDWPKRRLSAEDRKILGLIRDGVGDPDVQATLKPLLPAWLQLMAARAMD